MHGVFEQDLPAFTARLMNQLVVDLKRIRGLGGKRIAVTSLPPLGCLPRVTVESSFKKCNASANLGASYHNALLQKTVAKLNNETKGSSSSYAVLDIFTSFSHVIQKKQGHTYIHTYILNIIKRVSMFYHRLYTFNGYNNV